MGADLVIAVHLQTKPLAAKEPLSSFGVLGRSISVVVAANELRSMERADILISVPLEQYGSSDYGKDDAIIRLGYEAAATKASVLSAFSVDDVSWRSYLAERDSRRKSTPVPQFVEVTGTKPALSREIEQKLSNNLGKPIDSVELDRQLTYLTGVGRYSRVGYRMIEKDGNQGLLVAADEKEYGPPIIRPLLVIDGSQYNNVQFLIGARITFLDVGGFGSEWRNDLTLGSEHSIRSEFYRPLGERLHWFVAPRAYAENIQTTFYKGNTLIAEYRKRQGGAALDVGYAFSRNSELRIGYEAAEAKFSPYVGSATFGTLEGRLGTTSLQYNRLGRDRPIIPRSGKNLWRSECVFGANGCQCCARHQHTIRAGVSWRCIRCYRSPEVLLPSGPYFLTY
jgi:NTE family protein